MQLPYNLEKVLNRLIEIEKFSNRVLEPDYIHLMDFHSDSDYFDALHKYYKYVTLALLHLEVLPSNKVKVERRIILEDDKTTYKVVITSPDLPDSIALKLYINDKNDEPLLSRNKFYVNTATGRHTTYRDYSFLKDLLHATRVRGSRNVKQKTNQHLFFIKEGFLDEDYIKEAGLDLSLILYVLDISSKHNLLYYKKLYEKFGEGTPEIMYAKGSFSKISREDKYKYLELRSQKTIMEATTDLGFSSISFGQKIMDEVQDLVVASLTTRQKRELLQRLEAELASKDLTTQEAKSNS